MSEQMHAAFKSWLKKKHSSGKTLPEILAPEVLAVAAKGWTDGWQAALATQPQAPQGGDGPTEPIAYMRRWAFDGETPIKVKNGKGRMAWGAKFKFKPVTQGKVFPDDVALIAAPTETPEAGK